MIQKVRVLRNKTVMIIARVMKLGGGGAMTWQKQVNFKKVFGGHSWVKQITTDFVSVSLGLPGDICKHMIK
jgi:hypothetical protein